MRDYGYEMQRDFERKWQEFELREARRARLAARLRKIGKYIAYALSWLFLAAMGAIIGICACFPDYQCFAIFQRLGLIP